MEKSFAVVIGAGGPALEAACCTGRPEAVKRKGPVLTSPNPFYHKHLARSDGPGPVARLLDPGEFHVVEQDIPTTAHARDRLQAMKRFGHVGEGKHGVRHVGNGLHELKVRACKLSPHFRDTVATPEPIERRAKRGPI